MRRIYEKPAAEAARGLSHEEDGHSTARLFMPRSQQTYAPARDGQDFFFLDELADPPADEVAHQGYAHADHEHVEPGAERAATREYRPGCANQEVGQHRQPE